jgi:hypothetical protein
MGYAVFEGDARLSRAFETKDYARSKAENAGPLTRAPDGTVIFWKTICPLRRAPTREATILKSREAPDAFGASGATESATRWEERRPIVTLL